MLANPRSDRIKKVAALGGRSARLRHGRYLVEGPQAVREAIRFAAADVLDVYADPGAANPAVAEIAQEARDAGCYVSDASAEVMRAISSDCQSIAAVARLPLARDEESLRSVISNGSLVMCLPQISDPGNLGTLIRIADAAGADAVVVGPGSVELTNPKVIRSSAGSVFHLPVVTDAEFAEAADLLRENGYAVIGADGRATHELPNVAALSGNKLAWAFGNEAHGLNNAERAACDELAKIPLKGHAESLNVAAAAAVCLYSAVLCR